MRLARRTNIRIVFLGPPGAGKGTHSKRLLASRLAARRRADDRPEVAEQRLQQFFEQTVPLVEYYRRRGLLHSIAGAGSADEVFGRIKQVLAEIAAKRNAGQAGTGHAPANSEQLSIAAALTEAASISPAAVGADRFRRPH